MKWLTSGSSGVSDLDSVVYKCHKHHTKIDSVHIKKSVTGSQEGFLSYLKCRFFSHQKRSIDKIKPEFVAAPGQLFSPVGRASCPRRQTSSFKCLPDMLWGKGRLMGKVLQLWKSDGWCRMGALERGPPLALLEHPIPPCASGQIWRVLLLWPDLQTARVEFTSAHHQWALEYKRWVVSVNNSPMNVIVRLLFSSTQ